MINKDRDVTRTGRLLRQWGSLTIDEIKPSHNAAPSGERVRAIFDMRDPGRTSSRSTVCGTRTRASARGAGAPRTAAREQCGGRAVRRPSIKHLLRAPATHAPPCTHPAPIVCPWALGRERASITRRSPSVPKVNPWSDLHVDVSSDETLSHRTESCCARRFALPVRCARMRCCRLWARLPPRRRWAGEQC